MTTGTAITISLVLLAANAFFVGAEFALISARRSSIEPRAAGGGWAARTTLSAMENVSLMMAAAQLGITICSLGLGYLGEPAIAHLLEVPFEELGVPDALLHPLAFAIALGLIGYLHVVLGEMVPKNLALAGPDRAALLLAPPLSLLVRILRPVIAVLNWFANVTLRLAGIEPKDEVTSTFTRDEVAGLVDESRREGLLDPDESRLLTGALKLEAGTAATVLLPLAQLETVPPDVTPAQLEEVAARTGYSRFPVADAGALVGYLHIKDVLEFEDRHRNRPIARSWIRRLADVAGSEPLGDVLGTLRRSRAHLARARGDDGAVLGVVALEDVLEELVGEIRDEARAARPGARVDRRRRP